MLRFHRFDRGNNHSFCDGIADLDQYVDDLDLASEKLKNLHLESFRKPEKKGTLPKALKSLPC